MTPDEYELALAQVEHLANPDTLEAAMLLLIAEAWTTAPDSGYRLRRRRRPSTLKGLQTVAKQALVDLQRE